MSLSVCRMLAMSDPAYAGQKKPTGLEPVTDGLEIPWTN